MFGNGFITAIKIKDDPEKPQHARFLKTARLLGDEDEAAFDEN